MKTAIIGVGRMGRRHGQAIKALGWQIVGVCDQNAESLALTQQEFSLDARALFSDAAQMLSETAPQVVIIATTAPPHADLTCMAAAAGATHILCEKPMATSLADCDRMIATCEAHGTALAINHYMRFLDIATEPRRLIESEAFGELHSLTVSAGNIGLAMVGTHYMELFQHFTGESISEVAAWLDVDRLPNPRGAQFEDRAGSLRATTASGKRLYLEAGAAQGHGMKLIFGGTYGQLVLDPFSGTLLETIRRPENRTLPTTRYVTPSIDTTYALTPADTVLGAKLVLEALVTGDGYCGGREARNVIAALVAAYLSDETEHRAVRVDEALPRERTFPWA